MEHYDVTIIGGGVGGLSLASGSSPHIPPITGLDKISYSTNETVFSLKEQPKHLIVIIGGPIGFELAQAFAMLGSKVTLLDIHSTEH